MKKLFSLILVILLLSGCSIVYIDKQSIDEIIDSILVNDSNLKSVSLEGYSYYLPQGISLSRNDRGNSILKYNHNKMYLYVDLISYYHKVDYVYEKYDGAFYSKEINKNNKKGYLVINQVSDSYFIEFMYNYSKIEAYVLEKDINKTITQMAYVLNSIKFNDAILDSLVGEKSLEYLEEEFNIFKPNGEHSNFLDWVEVYDDGRSESKDEDILEIEGNIE